MSGGPRPVGRSGVGLGAVRIAAAQRGPLRILPEQLGDGLCVGLGHSNLFSAGVSARLLAAHALELLLRRRLLLIHELAGVLVTLRPGALAHDLAGELRTLAHGALPSVVSRGRVGCHSFLLLSTS